MKTEYRQTDNSDWIKLIMYYFYITINVSTIKINTQKVLSAPWIELGYLHPGHGTLTTQSLATLGMIEYLLLEAFIFSGWYIFSHIGIAHG